MRWQTLVDLSYYGGDLSSTSSGKNRPGHTGCSWLAGYTQSPRHSDALRCSSAGKCTDLGIACPPLVRFPLRGGLHRLSKLPHEILTVTLRHWDGSSRIDLFETSSWLRAHAFEPQRAGAENRAKRCVQVGVVGTQLNAAEPLIGARKGRGQAVGRSWTGRQQVTEQP